MTENHPAQSATEQHTGILHSRKAVLSFVFLVVGILGLPLIWMHPSFTRGQRIFWSVVVLIYTCTLLALAGSLMWWIYRQVIGY